MQVAGSLLELVLRPTEGGLTPEYARHVLDVDFSPADHARHDELSGKAQLGTLTAVERDELEQMQMVNDLLVLLQAKARKSLQPGTAA